MTKKWQRKTEMTNTCKKRQMTKTWETNAKNMQNKYFWFSNVCRPKIFLKFGLMISIWFCFDLDIGLWFRYAFGYDLDMVWDRSDFFSVFFEFPMGWLEKGTRNNPGTGFWSISLRLFGFDMILMWCRNDSDMFLIDMCSRLFQNKPPKPQKTEITVLTYITIVAETISKS